MVVCAKKRRTCVASPPPWLGAVLNSVSFGLLSTQRANVGTRMRLFFRELLRELVAVPVYNWHPEGTLVEAAFANQFGQV